MSPLVVALSSYASGIFVGAFSTFVLMREQCKMTTPNKLQGIKPGDRVRHADGWAATVCRVDGDALWLYEPNEGMRPEQAAPYKDLSDLERIA